MKTGSQPHQMLHSTAKPHWLVLVVLACLICSSSVLCQTTVKCPANCEACRSSTECTQCSQRYFPKVTPEGTFCSECDKGCQMCQEQYSCYRCLDGFSLITDTALCRPCTDAKCAECPGDVNKCANCVPGYSLNSSGKCTPDATHIIAMGLLVGLIIAGGCLIVLLIKWICFPSMDSSSHPRGAAYASTSDIPDRSKYSDVLDEDARKDPIAIEQVSRIGKESQHEDLSAVDKIVKPEIPRVPEQPDSFMGSAANPFSKAGRLRFQSKDSGLTKEMGFGSGNQPNSSKDQPTSYQFKERHTDELIEDMV